MSGKIIKNAMEGVTSGTTESGTNFESTAMPTKQPALYLAYNIVMMSITILIMFSMGSGTRWEIIKERLKRPVGPVIGVICQCFAFPAMMFGYAHALNIDDNISVGMILCASCPGGAVSNMFTFWARGDLDLSVTMTTISTCLSIGFLPLNMYIYARSWIPPSEMPFVDMVVTLLVVWVAVILGNIVGRVFPKSVYWLTRIGSVCGFTLILIAAVIQGALFPEVFNLSWTVWFGAITMPLIAFAVGFLIPLMFCLSLPQKTAIAFEVSLQNVALAITIITVSFPNAEIASFYSQYVILYGAFQIVFGVGISVLFQSYFRWNEKTTPCHYYVRWKQMKEESEQPHMHQMTVNGSTLKQGDQCPSSNSLSLTNMAYTGSRFDLEQMESEARGSGFMPGRPVSSTTELIRMDSVDSGTDLIVETSPATPPTPDESAQNGHVTFEIYPGEREESPAE